MWSVKDLLLGEKNGKKFGKMSNIVQLNVEEIEIKLMAHPPGFEPGTSASAGLRSIH